MFIIRKFNPEIHHRRSIRLKGFDYSGEGRYFITICTHNRDHIFGHIKNGCMHLNASGNIVRSEWLRTTTIRQNIELGAFIVMPNHFHGIMVINPDEGGARCSVPLRESHTPGVPLREPHTPGVPLRESHTPGVPLRESHTPGVPRDESHAPQIERFGKPTSNSIPTIVRLFKSTVTKQINIERNQPGQPVWQRNYYEHVIRGEREFNIISKYVRNNPKKWKQDRFGDIY